MGAQVERTNSNKVVIWEYEDSETSEQLTPELEFIFDSPETAKKIYTSFMALKWPDSEYPELLTTLLTEGVRSRSRTCSLTGPSARAAPLPTSKPIVDLPRRRRERRRGGQWFRSAHFDAAATQLSLP